MKKKILATVMIAFAATGFTLSAQDKNTNCEPACDTKCEVPVSNTPCKASKCNTPCTKVCTPTPCPRYNCFAGLNLTDDQKKKIKEMPSPQQLNKQARTDSRKAYLNNIKSILTPEQYVQFLENNYVNKVQATGFKVGRHHDRFAKHKFECNKMQVKCTPQKEQKQKK